MTLPTLYQWDNTRAALHKSLTPLLLARIADLDPLPNALRHSLIPASSGARSGQLNSGGEMLFDYTDRRIRYMRNDDLVFAIEVEGHSQRSLTEAVCRGLEDVGISLDIDLSKAEDETPLTFSADHAAAYAALQWRMYRALAILKARFYGSQTPLVLWPHGFDLSTLWFADGMDEHGDSHINFGFSPGTPDVGQPYLYFYVWPVQERIISQLPDIVDWHTDWSTPGGLIPYDRFSNESDPESLIIDTLYQVYEISARALRAE